MAAVGIWPMFDSPFENEPLWLSDRHGRVRAGAAECPLPGQANTPNKDRHGSKPVIEHGR